MTLFVVSAPSGTGKTTLNRRLMQEHPEVVMSVSHTTRKPRVGEVDGEHYHFINESEFKEMADAKKFVEWAKVHGNYYGTSFSELERIRKLGKTALLEIDVQGWLYARARLDNAISIFILPPSMESLWQRLEGRGSDSLETRWVRLQNAHDEIKNASHYDYFIVNEDLDTAYETLKSIIVGGKSIEKNTQEGRNYCQNLNLEYESAEWLVSLRKSFG